MTERRVAPVKNMYQGIFVKEFLLFYGETLHYYFQVEVEKDSYQTEEKILCMEDATKRGQSKYQLMNQMIIGRKHNQDTKVEETLEQYLRNGNLVTKLFQLME